MFVKWVPREQNKEANQMAQQALFKLIKKKNITLFKYNTLYLILTLNKGVFFSQLKAITSSF